MFRWVRLDPDIARLSVRERKPLWPPRQHLRPKKSDDYGEGGHPARSGCFLQYPGMLPVVPEPSSAAG